MQKAVLIMAGGRGERFWPKSRSSLPKQFLSLTNDGKTMIQLTVERILPLVPIENIYIETNACYKDLVASQLPTLPSENILFEPVGRNTAPCIGLGAIHMKKRFGDAVMIVMPADHIIKNIALFLQVLEQACKTAEQTNELGTIGIKPNYPETGYGYIRYDRIDAEQPFYHVVSFVEKPDLNTASQYLADGSYLWNSGMFIWTVSSILKSIKKHLPDLYDGLLNIGNAIGTVSYENMLTELFPDFPSESIDYGVMEKAEGIFIYPGDFGWDDVGSWLALERLQLANEDGNIINGNIVAYRCGGCILDGGEKLIAAVGLKDIVIVDTADAILVCNKNATSDTKKILELLRSQNKNEYI